MRRVAILVIAFLTFTTANCLAQGPEGNPTEGVHFVLMPYLIAPGMSGETTINGTQQNINASAGDIFSHLQLGFMARTRLSYNRWFVGTDTVYMGLGGANDVVNAGFDQWAAELLGGYRLRKRINLLGGVRYNSLSTNLQFKGPLGTNPRGAQVWWDPFFGGEASVPVTKKLDFSTRFDVGGFGVGSRIAVNAEPLLNYHFNQRFTATAGWKFLYQDYVNNGQQFEYDVLTQGPIIGLAIRW